MNHPFWLVPAVAVLVLASGCASPSPSSPSAQPGSTAPQTTPAATPTPSAPAVGNESWTFTGQLLGVGLRNPGLPAQTVPCIAVGALPQQNGFRVGGNHSALDFDLTWDRPADLFLDLQPPQGAASQVVGDPSTVTSMHLQHKVDQPPAGDWQVRVCGNGPEAIVSFTLAIAAPAPTTSGPGRSPHG